MNKLLPTCLLLICYVMLLFWDCYLPYMLMRSQERFLLLHTIINSFSRLVPLKTLDISLHTFNPHVYSLVFSQKQIYKYRYPIHDKILSTSCNYIWNNILPWGLYPSGDFLLQLKKTFPYTPSVGILYSNQKTQTHDRHWQTI